MHKIEDIGGGIRGKMKQQGAKQKDKRICWEPNGKNSGQFRFSLKKQQSDCVCKMTRGMTTGLFIFEPIAIATIVFSLCNFHCLECGEENILEAVNMLAQGSLC